MELYKISLWKLFLAGGVLMWPLLLCSIFALAIIIERFWYLRSINIERNDVTAKVLEKMKRHEIKEAINICDNSLSPGANILKAGILKYDRPRQQIIEALENASLYEVPKIEKNLPVLATIAHIAPLLGFLGTVAGLIECFQRIQIKSISFQPVIPADISGGIMKALLTTALGLIVAIPAFAAYNYLVSRANHFILEMEKASTELVNFLTE